MSKITLVEAAAPATPDAGKVVIYPKADGLMYSKDDAGTETLMSSGAGGGGMTDFTLAGDSGTPQTIADGNTATVAGGDGIDTVASATDTLTVAVDSTVIRTTGAQTLADKILSQLHLILGGFKAIFTHTFTADRTVTLPGDADVTLVGVATTQTLTNKTLTTPTIADLTNAAHNHTNAAGGGQITDAALSAAVGIAKGGTGQTTQTTAMNALSPTTTKGDILVDNGTDVIRLPVGVTNGHTLQVDSAEAAGMKWAAGGGAAAISGAGFVWDRVSTTRPTVSGTTSWVTMPLSSEENDTDDIIAVASNQININAAGDYLLNGVGIYLFSSSANTSAEFRVYNVTAAVEIARSNTINVAGSGTGAYHLFFSGGAFSASTSDKVEVQVKCAAATTLTFGAAVVADGDIRDMHGWLAKVG